MCEGLYTCLGLLKDSVGISRVKGPQRIGSDAEDFLVAPKQHLEFEEVTS